MHDVFSVGRYEHNRPYRHIFFLPENVYRRLSGSKPVYLFGGRGSGKTSLLKILDWKERLYNASLKACFKGTPFDDRIIGIYLKLPQQQLSTFERWLKAYEDDQAASVFGLYLDLLWMEDAILSIFELASNGLIDFSVDDQYRLLHEFNQEDKFRFLFGSCENNLSSLLEGIRRSRETLKQMALLRRDLSDFLDTFPVIEPGELGRRFAAIAFGEGKIKGLSDWSLKICFDEAEVLSAQQQVSLNSATRHTRAPLCYVFAFVSSARDLTSTIYENLSVNLADCEPVDLDQVGQAEFCRLVEGVATARVRALLPNCHHSIELAKIFGDISPNHLLKIQLSESVSKSAKDLIALGEDLSSLPFFTEAATTDEEDGEENRAQNLPFYQAYLIAKGVASIPQPETPAWANRAQESAQLRKRMVAAYLSICAELSLEPIYAGWRAAASIADNSVRDMIFQLDQIFSRRKFDIEATCESPLPPRDQDKCIREASNLKLRSLPEWVRIPHEKVRRLVESLGYLTRELQTSSSDNRHLRSSERGIYTLDKSQFESRRFELNRRIIDEAIYAGYIVEEKRGPDQIAIRLHRSLAPYFQFSYRGPYYSVQLAMADFDQMVDTNSHALPQLAASTVANRFNQQQTELPLFKRSNG